MTRVITLFVKDNLNSAIVIIRILHILRSHLTREISFEEPLWIFLLSYSRNREPGWVIRGGQRVDLKDKSEIYIYLSKFNKTYSIRTGHIGTNPVAFVFVSRIAPGTKGPIFETVSGVLRSRLLALAFEGNRFYFLVVAGLPDIEDSLLFEIGVDGLKFFFFCQCRENNVDDSTQGLSFSYDSDEAGIVAGYVHSDSGHVRGFDMRRGLRGTAVAWMLYCQWRCLCFYTGNPPIARPLET